MLRVGRWNKFFHVCGCGYRGLIIMVGFHAGECLSLSGSVWPDARKSPAGMVPAGMVKELTR